MDADMRERIRDDLSSSTEARFGRLYDGIAVPDSTPRYAMLLADREQRLWVERYPLPRDEETVWTIYTRDGARVGCLTLPEGVKLLDATADHVLLARSTILGSVRVQVARYTIEHERCAS